MTDTATKTAIQERLIEAIVEINPDVDAAQLTTETTFESIDIDSLDLVEIAQIMGDAYGVDLSSDALDEIKTVGDATEVISREAA